MIERKMITFIDSSDSELGAPVIQDTVLISENVTAEYENYGNLTFTVMAEPLATTGYKLDMAEARVFELPIPANLTDMDIEFMKEAKFIDVINRYAKGRLEEARK